MKILVISNLSNGLIKFRKELIQKLQENHEVFIATKVDMCKEELYSLTSNVVDIDIDRRGTNPLSEFELYKNYLKELTIPENFMIEAYCMEDDAKAESLLNIPGMVYVKELGYSIYAYYIFMYPHVPVEDVLKFDLTNKAGEFKILNATNGGPWHKRNNATMRRSNFEEYPGGDKDN